MSTVSPEPKTRRKAKIEGIVPEGELAWKRLGVSESGRLTFYVLPLPEPSPPMWERIRIVALTVALAMLFSIAASSFFASAYFHLSPRSLP